MRVLATVKEFMFPESHAHSFASIAYSSAYTRFHFPAAYTCALLNNQPMGFYSPATILNDAKRHGLKCLPLDVQHSEWKCTLELYADRRHTGPYALRLGFCYARGLRKEIGRAIAETRRVHGPFESEYDLQRRVPSIRKTELVLLANAGAFNWTGEKHHRRTALWRAERAGKGAGPLFEGVPDVYETETHGPLLPMTTEERLLADFKGTGLTMGLHPMAFHRGEMNASGVIRAADLHRMRDGVSARIAGAVIRRQRPATAAGFIFLSLEDETGISNAIIDPKLYDQNWLTVRSGKFLFIEGTLQNQDGVVSVKASGVRVLDLSEVTMQSHDFH
jgi:error-prone DNA polymerase